jgi:hypothetical protein
MGCKKGDIFSTIDEKLRAGGKQKNTAPIFVQLSAAFFDLYLQVLFSEKKNI